MFYKLCGNLRLCGGQMLAILAINMTINHKVGDYHKACKTCMV